jgi:uncharacterized protein (TIGR02599 family)
MRHHRRTAGFTLVEVLVVVGILVVLMTVLISMTNQTQRLVKSTSSKVEQFQTARVAFESMTRKLAQATLNTFWDYDYYNPTTGAIDQIPYRYTRNSDLRFRTGPMSGAGGLNPAGLGQPSLAYPAGNPQVGVGVMFHAPFGLVSDQLIYGALDTTINTWGYFVEIGDDSTTLPTFISDPGAPSAPGSLPGLVPPRRRYRLMELMVPTEELSVFKPTAQVTADRSWFLPYINGTTPRTRVVAENIVLLLVIPRLTTTDEKAWQTLNATAVSPVLAKSYVYDSSTPGPDETPTPKTIGWLNSKHQLPPVLQVIMVAIDEPSAQRLQEQFQVSNPLASATDIPGLGITVASSGFQQYLSGGTQLFTNPLLLEDTYTAGTKTPGDLSIFEAQLQSRKISYRIFSSKISVLGAKWSRAQNQ